MKAAQIGVGYWGPNLLRNLVANKSCEVTRVVDMSEARRAFVSSLYPSVAVTDRVEDVWRDETIDAVVIATPAGTHFELAMQALDAGKHILVEKPMAGTVAEVEEIESLADGNGLVAMVGHTFIFNSAVRYVKALIDEGTLGDVRYIYSQRLNLGRIRADVDALWNLAPHDVSIIQYWLDDPVPVKVCRHGMAYVQQNVDDVVFLNMEYPDNVLANVHVSWLDPRKVRQMTVVGSDKMVVYDDMAEHRIALYDKGIDPKAVLGENMDFDQPGLMQFTHRLGDVSFPQVAWQEPLKVEIDHFLDCIENGIECLTGTRHARQVVEILASSAGKEG
jgi:predicted dehydrogenase